MTLAAGKLRHYVEIQARSQSRSSTGAISWTWAKITNGDEWASIEPLSSREFIAAAAVQSKIAARIVMRYRADVTSGMRVVHNGRVYSIEGPPLADKDSGEEYMSLMVGAGVSLGA